MNPNDPPQGTGVTLVFYGAGTLTVEGHIGTINRVNNAIRDPLIASDPDVGWQPGQPIPGVAIVFDQYGSRPRQQAPCATWHPDQMLFSWG